VSKVVLIQTLVLLAAAAPAKSEVRIIRARVQPRPGAEVKEVDRKVHPSPPDRAWPNQVTQP